jgi:hypothetical protein
VSAKGYCSIANLGCKAPPGFRTWNNEVVVNDPGPIGTCFRCGFEVCTNPGCSRRPVASSRHGELVGRRRICQSCIDELNRNASTRSRSTSGGR